MSTISLDMIQQFILIVGDDVSQDEAEKYLKMGKGNMEASLNYFFRKKDKAPKQEEREKPKNIFEQLNEGSKNQAKVEKIIKELRKDYSKPIAPSSNPQSQKKQPDLKVTPYPNLSIEKKASSDSIGSASKVKIGDSIEVKKASISDRIETPNRSEVWKPLEGSAKMSVDKPVSSSRVSSAAKSTVTKHSVQNLGEKFERIGESVTKIDEEDVQEDQKSDFSTTPTKVFKPNEDFTIMSLQDIRPLSSEILHNRDTMSEPAVAEDADELFELLEQAGPEKPKKRKFKDLPSVEESKPIKEKELVKAISSEEKMLVETTGDDKWPKFLGMTSIKAHILSSFPEKLKEGDEVQLRREKQVLQVPKKGPKVKSTTAPNPTVVRVLYKDNEIGKLENEYSLILAPLLDKNYIFVEAKIKVPPATWSTFSPFWINLEVYLAETIITKPLTEICSIKDNQKNEDEKLLQELQTTKDAFVAIFDLLRVNRITETLIKRIPSKYSSKSSSTPEPSIASSKSDLKADSKVDIFDPFQRMPKQKSLGDFLSKSNGQTKPSENSPPKQDSQSNSDQVIKNESSDVNYESLLNLENDDNSELKLSDPPSTFASNLHSYQKQALTWMLYREGVNAQFQARMNTKVRALHPLWEEYLLNDGTHIYFNPYTGQVSKVLPKAAPDCLGGILADEMGLGKTVMMIALVHSNPYSRSDDSLFKKASEKKRKLNPTGTLNFSNLKPAGTLIVVPVTLLSQWESEFENHSNSKTIRVFVYYGDKRSSGKGDLGRYDVVITTYGIISNEFTSNGPKELFKYEWFRVVLDEAHYIKGRTIITAKAVYELSAIHKWCLSGTPIQNKLDDLFSLIHFLKLEPWSDYVWWNTYINKPNEKNDPVVFQILQSILRPILLRRTKKTQDKDGKLIIELPEKTSIIQYIELSKEERDFYDCLFRKSKREFDSFVEAGNLISNYAHIFEILLRLRQTCDHPFLIYSRPDVQAKENLESAIRKWIEKKEQEILGKDSDDEEPPNPFFTQKKPEISNGNDNNDNGLDHFEVVIDENNSNGVSIPIKKMNTLLNPKFLKETIERLKTEEIDNCPVCLNDVEDAVITICSHIACRYCLIRAIEMTSMCPICRTILTKKDFMTVPRDSRFSIDIDKQYKQSSKISALMKHIQEVVEKNEKCVIFSQFLGMLALVEHDLKLQGIEYVKLDGSLAQKKRAEVLEDFNKNAKLHVFLISLKAGGVGLNLTVANNAFLIDPWWNPAVEEQAVERVHRIGQKKPVKIVRFICRETIEERIIELHTQKKDLFNSTITYNQEERKQLNMENFKYLMKNYH